MTGVKIMLIKEKSFKIRTRQAIVMIVGLVLLACILVSLIKKLSVTCNENIANCFKPEKITFDLEHIYSPELAHKLTSFIVGQTSRSLLSFDQQKFLSELKERFNIIKKIEWKYCIPKTLHLTIIGAKPFCKINNSFVLCNKKQLYDISLFKNFELDALENVVMNTGIYRNKKNKLHKQVYTFLHSVPATRWEKFHITYHKPSYIELTPKESLCKCSIITDEKTFFDDQKLNTINAIFTDLYKKKLISNKNLQSQRPLIAFDMRFDERIVVKFLDKLKRGTGK